MTTTNIFTKRLYLYITSGCWVLIMALGMLWFQDSQVGEAQPCNYLALTTKYFFCDGVFGACDNVVRDQTNGHDFCTENLGAGWVTIDAAETGYVFTGPGHYDWLETYLCAYAYS